MVPSQRVAVGGENPKGGGQIVEEGPGGHGDAIEDGSFDRPFGIEQVDQKVEDQNLDKKREEGSGIVVQRLSPVGWPVMESPKGIEEIIGAATENPGKGGGHGDNGVVGGMPTEMVVADGEEEPNEEGIEEGSEGANDPKTDDA